MSKMMGYEKFFISMISDGMDNNSDSITIEDIEYLTQNSLEVDEGFNKRIKSALGAALRDYDRERIEENALRICKGRETRLREIVVKWYAGEVKPSFWDAVKGFFTGR